MGGKITGQLVRGRRTDDEERQDIQATNDGASLPQPPTIEKKEPKKRPSDQRVSADVADNPSRNARAKGGRVGFARGGKTGKGKTVVNVIVGGKGEQAQPQTPPMPLPMPPAAPPMPPPKPPGPPPGGGMPMPMPGGAAPMGAAGAPPPGVPPTLRARGGRIGIDHTGGTPGSVAPATKLPGGSAGGKGRMVQAKRAGTRIPKVEPLRQ